MVRCAFSPLCSTFFWIKEFDFKILWAELWKYCALCLNFFRLQQKFKDSICIVKIVTYFSDTYLWYQKEYSKISWEESITKKLALWIRYICANVFMCLCLNTWYMSFSVYYVITVECREWWTYRCKLFYCNLKHLSFCPEAQFIHSFIRSAHIYWVPAW